eukprot:TRINITY_DN9376_c0_g1_i2.p1 TRINITY_DN9376_c0_g1~~TRINITY_DN9376_c0_g1_i2.p1  ORF type:complete len:204 (+),score=31.58 TRINITY_DN9376_c0_g1_i2:26-637(+)
MCFGLLFLMGQFKHDSDYFVQSNDSNLHMIHRKKRNKRPSPESESKLVEKEVKRVKHEDEDHVNLILEVERQQKLNNFLFTEMNKMKEKAETQTVTINYILQQLNLARNEIELLKSNSTATLSPVNPNVSPLINSQLPQNPLPDLSLYGSSLDAMYAQSNIHYQPIESGQVTYDLYGQNMVMEKSPLDPTNYSTQFYGNFHQG